MVNPEPVGIQVSTPKEQETLARVTRLHMSVEQLKEQLRQVQKLQQEVMVKGEDYDVIPGTTKPTLHNPGAEKLCWMFGLAPRYEPSLTYHDGTRHLTVLAKCFLYQRDSGLLWGESIGTCSSKESKYAWRVSKRVCPSCGEDTIRKSDYGGWYCNANKGGCGAKFLDGEKRVEEQKTGRIENPDLEDTHNTVLKMSMKRAFVGATRTATAAGHLFTQDLEPGDDDNGHGPAAEGDPQLADPRVFFEQIDAAADKGQLNAVGLAIAETQMHPRDRDDLEKAYRAKLQKLAAASGASQKAKMDSIAEQHRK